MSVLHPVYLVQCLFLLYSLFLCVACAAEASFDKKGLLEAVQCLFFLLANELKVFCRDYKRQAGIMTLSSPPKNLGFRHWT